MASNLSVANPYLTTMMTHNVNLSVLSVIDSYCIYGLVDYFFYVAVAKLLFFKSPFHFDRATPL